MKQYKFLYILTCMFCLFFISACEKAKVQITRSEVTVKDVISNRTVEDCDECPNDYCCCVIQLWHGTEEALISLCGLEDGTYACGPFDPDPCNEFSGAGEDVPLDEVELPAVFVCVEENGVVRIFNNGIVPIVLRFTCQFDQMNPQWVEIALDEDESIFFSTNGSCGLTECS